MIHCEEIRSLLINKLPSSNVSIADADKHNINNWHAAVILDSVECLDKIFFSEINNKDLCGKTALDIAFDFNRSELISRLQEAGAVLSEERIIPDNSRFLTENFKSVHLPASQGKLVTLRKRYGEGHSLNVIDVEGNTPLHLAAKNGHLKLVKDLTENHFMFGISVHAQNNLGETPRTLAIAQGHADISEQLLIWEIHQYILYTKIVHQIKSKAAMQH